MKINVNELLSGEKIMAESYDKRAEENLLAIKCQIEEKNRQMLRAEYWITLPAVLAGLVMMLVASFVEMPMWLRTVLIAFALVMIFTVASIAVGIEQKAGYYECQKCGHRYVPTYRQTNLAPHFGRTRRMKCPKCGKRSWAFSSASGTIWPGGCGGDLDTKTERSVQRLLHTLRTKILCVILVGA